jgi:hypothetical protein
MRTLKIRSPSLSVYSSGTLVEASEPEVVAITEPTPDGSRVM